MLGGLIPNRITWKISPTAPQVLSVILGSPLCPWCFGHSSWRGAQHVWRRVGLTNHATYEPNMVPTSQINVN